jgi:hypothetical protein
VTRSTGAEWWGKREKMENLKKHSEQPIQSLEAKIWVRPSNLWWLSTLSMLLQRILRVNSNWRWMIWKVAGITPLIRLIKWSSQTRWTFKIKCWTPSANYWSRLFLKKRKGWSYRQALTREICLCEEILLLIGKLSTDQLYRLNFSRIDPIQHF